MVNKWLVVVKIATVKENPEFRTQNPVVGIFFNLTTKALRHPPSSRLRRTGSEIVSADYPLGAGTD